MHTRVLFGILFVVSLGTAVPAERSELTSVLEQMARASEHLETLRAELVQVKTYPQLSLSDRAEKGRLYVQRKDTDTRFRLTIVEPEPRSVVFTDGQYVLYQPKINQAVIGRLNQDASVARAGFLTYLLGDLSAAEQDFDIEGLGDENLDGEPTVRLRLSAKPGSHSPYLRIDLWVQKEIWLPVRQELTELNQSRTQIDLRDISINETIDEKVFEIDLPRDVERVQG